MNIPKKKWEDMTNEEKIFFSSLSESELISRWQTDEGHKIKNKIIAINLKYGNSKEYSEFIGTIKNDLSKRKPKFDLRGISFENYKNAQESQNEIFSFDFSNCCMTYSNFHYSTFILSDFSNSDILYSDFSDSILDECDFSHTNITLSNFSNSSLEIANFKNCWMTDANFSDSNLGYIKFNDKTQFQNLNITCFEGTTSPLFIKHLKRTHYLNHFKTQSTKNLIVYYFWWMVSDCGQSLTRWFLSSAFVIFFLDFCLVALKQL